jgi:hypothetical protein
MKLIGQGLQYRVFDLGSGRVRKIETSAMHKAVTLAVWYLPSLKRMASIPSDVRSAFDSANRSISWMKDNIHRIDASMIGNPEFFQGNDYEQDKVTPLGSFLRSHSQEENMNAIQGYIASVLRSWEFGFSDIVFNYTYNAGKTK